jgi:hypothetical protein
MMFLSEVTSSALPGNGSLMSRQSTEDHGLTPKPLQLCVPARKGARPCLQFGPAKKAKGPATESISSLIP